MASVSYTHLVVLAIYMAADFAVSINEAMDLKAVSYTHLNQSIISSYTIYCENNCRINNQK